MSVKVFLDRIMLQIKHYREDAGLSQAEMSELLKIGSRSYQRYEIGETVPPISFLFEAAKILNLNLDDLLCPYSRLARVMEVTFFNENESDKFKSLFSGSEELFSITRSRLFKLALEKNQLELLLKDQAFNHPTLYFALSTPKVTLLNSCTQTKFGEKSSIVPTSTFHSSPKNVGTLWGALLQCSPAYFIIANKILLNGTEVHLKAFSIFIFMKGKYFILRKLHF